MHPPPFLRDLLVILAVAVVVVAALRRIGLPSIAGFVIAGALVGPAGLGLIHSLAEVSALAEVGVVLLLFGVGVELSLERLRRLWRPVLLGGALQVGLTTLVVFALMTALGAPGRSAVFVGFVLAVSSTAIVLRVLESRGEIDAPHGRLTLGILVFQDLSVVPMLLLLPLLASTEGDAWAPVTALMTAIGVLAMVLVAARLVVPRLLDWVARTRQRDLFALAVVVVSLGTAWSVSAVGVSLALGAFLAGLVVSGSAYRTQALAELIPFREVLTSVFFVSVGMLLDPVVIAERAGPIATLLIMILAGKFTIVLLTGVLLRWPLRATVRAGAALAQVGEFAFVLLGAARDTSLYDPILAADLNAAAILSMMITPMVLALGPRVAAGVERLGPLARLLDVRTPEGDERATKLAGHVIIAGYGIAGQELALALEGCGVPYAIVDLNPANVRAAEARGEPAYFGDVTSPEVLRMLRVGEARVLVIVVNDPQAAVSALAAIRRVTPDLPIVVRARYVLDGEPLLRAGANEVVLGELEAAAEVTARVLKRCGLPAHEVAVRVQAIRARHQGDT